jgi:hypothetical protein
MCENRTKICITINVYDIKWKISIYMCVVVSRKRDMFINYEDKINNFGHSLFVIYLIYKSKYAIETFVFIIYLYIIDINLNT